MAQKLIAYYRVSTARQGASGLGLEGQAAAVMAHARASGGHVLRTYTEIETGKRADRPELAKALADYRLNRVNKSSERTRFLKPISIRYLG